MGVAHAPTPPHYQVNVCATPNMISINQGYLLEEFISKKYFTALLDIW